MLKVVLIGYVNRACCRCVCVNRICYTSTCARVSEFLSGRNYHLRMRKPPQNVHPHVERGRIDFLRV